ncbi:hypothetical protein ATB98_20900 [Sinorhizobium saheli]|uniref:Uncharacterized protein n=1 Tax=Sinorhizobium saheli TaxID=36856 RepID=A0A178YNA7_SINSA|nr:hypothetical protein ATB98_20900 [Sinorhizobium saheli]
MSFTPTKVTIEDDCGGISFVDARDHVFVFGAADQESHQEDQLSVYGIGLKRAMFKLGKNIQMTSDHKDGGFELKLDVGKWAESKEQPWKFNIDERPRASSGTTTLEVTALYKAVTSRLSDALFESQLRDRIARAYSFFISKIIDIYVNGHPVVAEQVAISDNQASENFSVEDVNVAILAGLGVPKDKRYVAETAGWNVYCNGRSVISYDKTSLTGWGVDGLLPAFQPKHRPFVGIVFFTSDHPESLPWTTTKLGVNTDNIVWQRTLKRMADIGKQVTRFLDARYSEDGTSISSDELQDAIGSSKTVTLKIASTPLLFKAPPKPPNNMTTIQYKVEKKQLADAKAATGQKSISNSEFGRYTFDYFVDNEVN